MDNKRNGLLEVYRLLICFWPLYFHNFLPARFDRSVFGYAELSLDFFFIISGLFLMRIYRREKDTPVLKGACKITFGRVRPIIFTMAFIAVFNFTCVLLFVKENYYDAIHLLFRYWWFILFLAVAVGVFYIFYRLLKREWLFAIFLALLGIGAAVAHYFVAIARTLPISLQFYTRTLCFIPLGILLSFIPPLRWKRFNINTVMTVILALTLLYLAYKQSDFPSGVGMIVIFASLVYFSLGTPVVGRVFDLIGQLSVRVYLYMSFITMFFILGITDGATLFLIDVSVAVIDVLVTNLIMTGMKFKAKRKAENSK